MSLRQIYFLKKKEKEVPDLELALGRLGILLEDQVDNDAKIHDTRILANVVAILRNELILLAIAAHHRQLRITNHSE